MILIVVALGSLISAAIGVGIFSWWARRAGLLDFPNPRSSHDVPTPRGAGAILVVIVGAATGCAPQWLSSAPFAIVAVLGIVLVSAWDDLRPLPSWLRLLVHAICAIVAVRAIYDASGQPWTPTALMLAVIWLVGLTNAYNFMDGVDGIGGAQAVVSGMAVVAASLLVNLTGPAVAGTAIAAASAGFLVHNWPPARVFMGDIGSAFLGFSLGLIALEVGRVSTAAAGAIALSLWPFIFDTTVTLIRRTARGENILASHRSHLYQRLVIVGWTHARVTILYSTLAALGAAAGLMWTWRMAPWQALLAVPAMAAALYALVVSAEASAATGASPASARVQRRSE